jgi:hypothetical protein
MLRWEEQTLRPIIGRKDEINRMFIPYRDLMGTHI